MNAAEIANRLGGKKVGGGYLCKCPAHNDRTPSLRIADGAQGTLLVRCYTGCSPADVLRELASRALLGERRELTDAERLAMERQQQDDDARRVAAARAVLRGTVSGAALVGVYLRHRGITIPTPRALRFSSALLHRPSGQRLPAMVAEVTSPKGIITGCHRTWLQPDGRGKAPIDHNKMMLGCCAGGAVHLAPAAPRMAIAEGIETAASVLQSTGLPTWAALSTSGLKALVLPSLPMAAEVVIAADHDVKGAGLAAAELAARRWIAEGRSVRIAMPPEPGTDFNDLLRAAPDGKAA